jgi:hemoglobin
MTQTTAMQSLFERLGGTEGIEAIASDVVDRHLVNPIIKPYFAKVEDVDALKSLVADFFNMGTGGPAQYQGRDMRSAHLGMNLNERDLVSAIDDVLAVLDSREIAPSARAEVLTILYTFKEEILFQ